MTRRMRALCALAAVFAIAALCFSVAEAADPEDVLLPVPQRSQIDGSVWGPSDCGPASLAMVLEAFGDKVATVELRKRANQLLGVSSPDTGTKIEHLAQIARERGFSVVDPLAGKNYRRWTLDQARAEVRAGHPVVAQVYFPYLPNQRRNPVVTDHFVVLVGLDGSGFIYNDPADTNAPGYRQRMTEAELTKAWGWSGAPFAAFSIGPGSAGSSLLPPPPPTPTPIPAAPLATVPPAPEPTSTPVATPEPVPAEPANPEHLPRQATGGEEIRKPASPLDQLPPFLPPPVVLALLIVSLEIRHTWWSRPPSRRHVGPPSDLA